MSKYGMFSDAGEKEVARIVQKIEGLELKSQEAWHFAYMALGNLSLEDRFAEAADSEVRERLFMELEQRNITQSNDYSKWMDWVDEMPAREVSYVDALRNVIQQTAEKVMEGGYSPTQDKDDIPVTWVGIADKLSSETLSLQQVRALITDIDENLIEQTDTSVFNEFRDSGIATKDLVTMAELSTNDALKKLVHDVTVKLSEDRNHKL